MSQPVRTSDAFWQNYDTIDKWRNFVRHDFSNPSREIGYELVGQIVRESSPGRSFAEIGFGGCYDFKNCFKGLHDIGCIKYTGLDRTAYFVDYARQDFPAYDFQVREFNALERASYDITYTRHTMQHAAPEEYQKWITRILEATRGVCIIVWHPPLSQEHFDWNGGWNNTYDRETVNKLIDSLGFSIELYEAGQEDEIYVMRRHGNR